MSTSVLSPKRMLALSVVAGVGLAFASFTIAEVAADPSTASSTTTIHSSCRSNGAPMKYNVTRPAVAKVSTIGPESVVPGETIKVRIVYYPENIPGEESLATVSALKDWVVRFTIDDPSAFVTAELVGTGSHITTTPKVTLVGGNTLVMSNIDVAVNGKDTTWSTPEIHVTMKVPDNATSLPTFHPAVEGPAGEFNNPANYLTMKSVAHTPILGDITVQLNCVAQTGPETLLRIPVKGAVVEKPKPTTTEKKTTEKKTEKKGVKSFAKSLKSKVFNSDDKATKTDALDDTSTTDNATDTSSRGSSFPGWATALIVLACAGAVGGGVYGGVRARRKREQQ